MSWAPQFAAGDVALSEPARFGSAIKAFNLVTLIATLLTPVFLMHGHAIAEGTIGLADIGFLARCALTGDWGWLRRGWVPLGIAWWGWLVVCSLPLPAINVGEGGIGSAVQAAATLRFLLFAAALDVSVLRRATARRWIYGVVAACTAYILLNVALQFLTGHNIYGEGSAAAGELTGPFDKPRAGPPLARMILPVTLPPAALLLAHRRMPSTVAAYALLLLSACLVVTISQRMPTALTATGLLLSALLLPRLRPVVVSRYLRADCWSECRPWYHRRHGSDWSWHRRAAWRQRPAAKRRVPRTGRISELSLSPFHVITWCRRSPSGCSAAAVAS